MKTGSILSGKNAAKHQPVTNRVVRVPVVIQQQALDCGAVSLSMIMSYFGLHLSLDQIRKECGVSRDGSNLKSIYLVAERHGLEARAFRYETATLRKKGTFPCIVHWEFDHFVVLDGFRGNKAILNDPARGLVKIPIEEFDESFTGICLFLRPTEAFEPGGKPASIFGFARERLRGTGSMFALIVLTTLITSIVGIFTPAFSRFFVDRLLTGENSEWSYPFFVILIILSLIQLAAAWVKALYLLKLQGKMAIVADTSFVWHVLRLPIEFYSQRMAGDIVNRQTSNQDIANTLLNTFAPLALDLVSMLFYMVLMVQYSPLLALVGVSSVLVNLTISYRISKRRINITRVQMKDVSKLNGLTTSGIDMIETIKSAGAESGFFANWAGIHAAYNDQMVKYAKLNQYIGQIPSLITLLTSNIVLFLGVLLIMQGEWTVGLITAFTGYLSAFTAPATSLIATGQSFQEMRTNMERVQDVFKYEPDVKYHDQDSLADIEYAKLSGAVEIRGVSFGYNILKPPLIEDFSLKLEPGQSVALVGGSGSGKSTLSKLISGLYAPWDGEILFDGKASSEINHGVFTSSVACVDQDIILFEDTIANNIKLWDNSIEDFAMILAARDAQMHDVIMHRDGGYQYRLAEGGRDFSGGQCQRLEIARMLAQEPTLVILDEATSALDAQTEHDVMCAIARSNITRIVISHRLSTVRDCDEIIVLRQGKVVDRGTHTELMERCAYYRELIADE
jgi:NHLM bacteriocin system ABC transporter peptidase/ATP-binding protein